MPDKKQQKVGYLLIVAIIFFSFAIITWIAFSEIKKFPLFIFAVIFTLVFMFAWFMAWLTHKNYKLKFFLFRKSLKEQVQTSLAKFNTTNKEFIKEFEEHSKEFYKNLGKIYNFINIPILEKKDETEMRDALKVYSELVHCVKNKTGIETFFNEIEKLNFSRQKKYFLIFNDLLSNELLYFFTQLNKLTFFTFHDNELCEEFTKINEKNKEIVKSVYDPILYNFENELDEVMKKMESYVNG